MKKKIKLGGFLLAYLIFTLVLAILVGAALIYVNSVLDEYEEKHTSRLLEQAIINLKNEAADGTLFQKEGVPAMVSGKFENGTDPKTDFIKKLDSDIKFTSQKWISETECTYGVLSDGLTIAEITMKKIGEPKIKLAIISMQEYELVSYRPVSHTYRIELEDGVILGEEISLTVNGIPLTEADAESSEAASLTFTLTDIYNKPHIEMTDNNGNVCYGKLPDTPNGSVEFDSTLYTLTLPDHLSVSIDGNTVAGELLHDGRSAYKIRLAKKAKVELTDLFGNTIEYTGTTTVPLTCYTFMTSDRCTVKVDGKEVPDKVMKVSANPEYKNFAELVPDLPRLPIYEIVVLKNNADISITKPNGETVEFLPDKTVQDLTGASAPESFPNVPKEIADKINVIRILEDWSLFMSCDLDFSSLSKHLIKNSYQYNVAYKYNYSIDRTFTSIHSLKNPAFTEESATNFTYLTDDCFSVDIRFVKHMIVAGRDVDDEMNERCYFVKDSAGNWKLVGMKEVISDAK